MARKEASREHAERLKERLTLQTFAAWLRASLNARAASRVGKRKVADDFQFVGAADVLPRLMDRLLAGVCCW